MIIGFDLSSRLNGWCAGDGSALPVADAFRLTEHETLGRLGVEFKDHVLRIQRRFGATHWVYEQPLLAPHDHRITLQRIYGVTFLLCTLAESLSPKVVCHPVGHADAKKEFAGRGAAKADMVAIAQRIGVALPATKEAGQEDAADAIGVWKVGVRLFARQHLEQLDRAVYSRRTALL